MKYRGSWHEAEASKLSASRQSICLEDYVSGKVDVFVLSVKSYVI